MRSFPIYRGLENQQKPAEASSRWLIKAIELFSLSKGLIRHSSILGTRGIVFVSSA